MVRWGPGTIGTVVLSASGGEGLANETDTPPSVIISGNILAERTVTASSVSLGRFMTSQSVGGASTLATTGSDDSYTRVTVNGTLFNSATTTSSYNLPANTYAQGAVNGSISLPVTGEGLAGEGSYSGVIVPYSGNSLQQRTVTASAINLGRFMTTWSVGGASTLSTTGSDSSFTRVTVNGTLFNSATSTSSYNLAANSYGQGTVSGSVILPVVTAEDGGLGLAGEGTYSGVIVPYSGNSLYQRVVTASTIGLGRFMTTQSVGGSSTLSTAGGDNSFTRVTVNGTLFNSATSTSSYNLAANTYAQGAVSGSVSLPVTGEGLTGEGTYSGVIVPYSGNSLQKRTVTASSIGLGRFMASQGLSGASLLSTSGDDDSNTRVTVNGTLFNSATSTSSYNLSGPVAPGAVGGSVNLPVTGEGLAGEGSYADVIVSYKRQRPAAARGDRLADYLGQRPRPLHGQPACGRRQHAVHQRRRRQQYPRDGQRHALQLGHQHQHLQPGLGHLRPGAVGGIGQPAGDGRRPGRRGQLCRRDRQLQRQRLATTHRHRLGDRLGPLHGQPERGRRQHALHQRRR